MANLDIKEIEKLPSIVEAVEFTGGLENASEILKWIIDENGGSAAWSVAQAPSEGPDGTPISGWPEHIAINTLEGIIKAEVGWWIIKGIEGEFYPIRPDILERSYRFV